MIKPLRVLIVEDSEDDVVLSIHALRKGGYEPEYERVEDAGSMRKALEEGSWDVILCDYQMPKFDGLAAIAMLKETGIDTPLIIVSGAIGEETAVECMRSGARDYVMKDNLRRLASAVERELKETESRRQCKHADEALAQRNKRLDLAQSVAKAGIWDWDITTGQIEWSRHMFGLFGLDPQRTTASFEAWRSALHPEDVEIAGQRIDRALKERRHLNSDYRVILPDGRIRWINAVGDGEYDSLGRPVRMIGICIDITDSKQAAEQLQANHAQLSNALEMAHLGHWEYDVASDLFTFNDPFYKIFRTTAEQVGGYTMHSAEYAHRFVHPDDRDRVGEETRKAVETTDPHFNRQIEHRMLYADGTVGFIAVRFFIVKDSLGRTVKTYGVNQDITERKIAEQKLKDLLGSLRSAVGTTIQVMVSAVETRDPYTSGHQIRSADLARAIATEMGLSPEKIEGIRMAGSIHDIGKLSIPAEILSKPTKLSEIEFSLIKEHARQGYEILKDVESPWPLAEMVYQHHERMDGSGYPRQLRGEEILIEARIMAVADVVEAMASHRPYRPGLGIDAALNEIEKNRGVSYDNAVADACLKLFREKGFKLEGTKSGETDCYMASHQSRARI